MRWDGRSRERGFMKRDPVLIVSALMSALGPLVGNGLYPGPTGSDEHVLATLRDGLPTVAYVAYSIELAGFAATVVLVGWLVAFLRHAAPVAAASVGVAGAAMLAVKVGSAGPPMAALSLADKIDATTADLLFNLNGQAFVIDGFFTSIAFGAAGFGLLKTSVPRWLAWWPAVLGVLGTVAAGIGITSPQAYFPVPFLLLLVWLIALAIRSSIGRDLADPLAGEPMASTMTV